MSIRRRFFFFTSRYLTSRQNASGRRRRRRSFSEGFFRASFSFQCTNNGIDIVLLECVISFVRCFIFHLPYLIILSSFLFHIESSILFTTPSLFRQRKRRKKNRGAIVW